MKYGRKRRKAVAHCLRCRFIHSSHKFLFNFHHVERHEGYSARDIRALRELAVLWGSWHGTSVMQDPKGA